MCFQLISGISGRRWCCILILITHPYSLLIPSHSHLFLILNPPYLSLAVGCFDKMDYIFYISIFLSIPWSARFSKHAIKMTTSLLINSFLKLLFIFYIFKSRNFPWHTCTLKNASFLKFAVLQNTNRVYTDT